MSVDQNNETTTQGLSSPTTSLIPNVKFIINPRDRQETSASLVDSQDLLMSESFPRNKDDYSISLVLHAPTVNDQQEWNFIKNTLITFEGMIKQKLKADVISSSYQEEAPLIVLYFPNAVSPEETDILKSLHRARIIRKLLKDYHEKMGGLNYYLSDEAQPSLWAADCVFFGIINKDNNLLG